MRTKIVAGNWKMNKTHAEGLALVAEILERAKSPKAQVVFATPATHLQAVSQLLEDKKSFSLAAQNLHQEEKGAFTGEISADMLCSVGCRFVLIGHSERRQYFKEDSQLLAKKVNAALSRNLTPIFCCGEPLAIREKGIHEKFVAKQLKDSLFHLEKDQFSQLVLAYEPIWAIGTGVTASTAQAQEMHAAIRKMVARKFGKRIANNLRILYGGSCNASNAAELFSQPDVDGGLIGGASLKADDFVAIINAIS